MMFQDASKPTCGWIRSAERVTPLKKNRKSHYGSQGALGEAVNRVPQSHIHGRKRIILLRQKGLNPNVEVIIVRQLREPFGPCGSACRTHR